jgi:hypothetical protein
MDWMWTIRVEARNKYDTVHATTFRSNSLSTVLAHIQRWWEKIEAL